MMKRNSFTKKIPIYVCLSAFFGMAQAHASARGFVLENHWMNSIVNKTPVKESSCPEIETDIYGNGFRVALQKSFHFNLEDSGHKWFPKNEFWVSVGLSPVVDSFGIYFSDIKKLSELSDEKEKLLPVTYEKINQWKVSDSAYWESLGGVSFYLGAGISPLKVGVFAIASGGWIHFLQKTGPNKIYIELLKKNIKSIGLGIGTSVTDLRIQKAFEKSNGFTYEFTLNDQQSIEAYERFMVGDVTKAQELSKVKNSGVIKISDMSESRTALTKRLEVAMPYLPIVSFKISREHSYDHFEENAIWDDNIVKDAGLYIKQRNTLALGQKINEALSFIGGTITSENTERLYGNFKFTYQSNKGQEDRLRKYLLKAKTLTGLIDELCVKIPPFKDSMGFNQIALELNWSDNFIKEIIGFGKSKANLLPQKKAMAKGYQLTNNPSAFCDFNEFNCESLDSNKSSSKIDQIFKNLEMYSTNMRQNHSLDKKEFAKNMAKFGEEIWKSPFVFKAFFEKGKYCGQDFKFEVSGLRLTRLLINKSFLASADCSVN